MNNTNELINGDNKGYASILMEQAINGEDALTGKVSKQIINCVCHYCMYNSRLFFPAA